ncbi:unnamed protein product [Pleuronectes platessa]|uniref:Uncharacterized protein n=1 Tax=Pleuronectes platessa TaxID=8262 RepID=A0A9N7YY84_PLEPL|nr:unnamed protein product [Pleuronectes platessa]
MHLFRSRRFRLNSPARVPPALYDSRPAAGGSSHTSLAPPRTGRRAAEAGAAERLNPRLLGLMTTRAESCTLLLSADTASVSLQHRGHLTARETPSVSGFLS